jgi:hypothetical protein
MGRNHGAHGPDSEAGVPEKQRECRHDTSRNPAHDSRVKTLLGPWRVADATLRAPNTTRRAQRRMDFPLRYPLQPLDRPESIDADSRKLCPPTSDEIIASEHDCHGCGPFFALVA